MTAMTMKATTLALMLAMAWLGAPSATAQAWRDCIQGSIGPGGCESIGPGGGRSIGPGGGLSIGPGGGLSTAPGGGLGPDRDWRRGLDPTTIGQDDDGG